jgi:hypothetical protein
MRPKKQKRKPIELLWNDTKKAGTRFCLFFFSVFPESQKSGEKKERKKKKDGARTKITPPPRKKRKNGRKGVGCL